MRITNPPPGHDELSGVSTSDHHTRTSLANNANNRMVTATGDDDDPLNGEANLTFSTDLSITSGNVVIATAGKGIDFDAAAGGDSQLLDWYEEGTWTPALADDSSDGSGEGQGYSYAVGTYTRVGRLVTVAGSLSTSSFGSLTGGQQARIVGLPFAAINTTSWRNGMSIGHLTGISLGAASGVTARMINNGAYMLLEVFDGTGGTSAMTITEMTTGSVLNLGGTYEV